MTYAPFSKALIRVGLLIVAAALVQTASACSVCAVGKEEARGAYYATTALMSLLPLCMVGGLIVYLRKHSR